MLNKSILHKVSSKTTLPDLQNFLLFHLMENLQFDLSNTIYINIVCILRNLRGMDDIYYIVLINKILWDQGVYHVFNKLNDESKHNIMVKGSIVFNKTNLKAIKITMEE